MEITSKDRSHPKVAHLETATYSLSEFAKLAGASYTTFHLLAQADGLPVKPIRFGRTYRFPKSAVDRLLGIETAPDQAA